MIEEKVFKEKRPLLTVSIAAYNRLSLLKRCVSSVMSQIEEDIEILIVDDGSEAETKQWLRALEKSNVNIVYQKNQGVAKARQVGLENTKSEYLFVLDSDDVLISGALSSAKKEILSKPEVCLFYSNNIERNVYGRLRISNYKCFKNAGSFIHAIFFSPRIPYKHSGTIYKVKDALMIGGYDPELKSKIDIDFLVRFLLSGKDFGFIREPLVEFYFHFDSISRNTRIKAISTWKKILRKNFEGKALQKYTYLIFRVFWEFAKYVFESIVRELMIIRSIKK